LNPDPTRLRRRMPALGSRTPGGLQWCLDHKPRPAKTSQIFQSERGYGSPWGNPQSFAYRECSNPTDDSMRRHILPSGGDGCGRACARWHHKGQKRPKRRPQLAKWRDAGKPAPPRGGAGSPVTAAVREAAVNATNIYCTLTSRQHMSNFFTPWGMSRWYVVVNNVRRFLQGAASGQASATSRAVDSDPLRNGQDKYVKDRYVSSTLVGTSEGKTGQ